MIDARTVLAIETSCDETAVSIVRKKDQMINVLAHVVESQTDSHAPFGGVVPEIAARDHLAKIDDIARDALKKANTPLSEISQIAVTMGPGLIGALMVGVLYARGLALSLNKPLVAINHVDAHLAPALLLEHFSPSQDLNSWLPIASPLFPALALTVSGGHCHLSYLTNVTERVLLGKSLDDACGEAFDKVGKLLGLSYPGGPLIEKLAQQVDQSSLSKSFSFPTKIADKENRFGFSYSGLKTSVMEAIRKETGIKKGKVTGKDLPIETKQALAYCFEQAALSQLLDRVQNALIDFPQTKSILVAGGVAQNKKFRSLFSTLSKPVRFAPPALCSDNATMIALQALLLSQPKDGFIEQPFSRYNISKDRTSCQKKN